MEKIILLYYKYIKIANPQALAESQRELCSQLNLLGRIIVAPEGINGTLAGLADNCKAYMQAMNDHELFSDMPFKTSPGYKEYDYFEKLSVKVKPEIVNYGAKAATALPENSGTYLTPEEAHEFLNNQDKDVVIFDGRNQHEAQIGRFTGAIVPTVRYSREFADYFDNNLELFTDKKVLMYCTGGVRCERLSAYLKNKNVAKEIYHIKGGIHEYINKYPNGHFRGKNYVFDQRIAVPVTDDILGNCLLCKTPCDEFTNCASTLCNEHFICCESCLSKFDNTCSSACLEALTSGRSRRRSYSKKPPVFKQPSQP